MRMRMQACLFSCLRMHRCLDGDCTQDDEAHLIILDENLLDPKDNVDTAAVLTRTRSIQSARRI